MTDVPGLHYPHCNALCHPVEGHWFGDHPSAHHHDTEQAAQCHACQTSPPADAGGLELIDP